MWRFSFHLGFRFKCFEFVEIWQKKCFNLRLICLFEYKFIFSYDWERERERIVKWLSVCPSIEYFKSIDGKWHDETGGNLIWCVYLLFLLRKSMADFRRISFKYIMHEHEKMFSILYTRSFLLHSMWSHSIYTLHA